MERNGLRSVAVGIAALSGLVVGGCKETVDGDFVDTEGIALIADVTATDTDGSEVEIDFVVGGDESNTFVDLSDDRVIVSADGEEKDVRQSSIGEFNTSFDTAAGGAEFTIELLRRESDKVDAPDNWGVLPDGFTLSLEPEGEISRQEELTIHWDPADNADEVRIDVDGDCVFFTFEAGEEDDGQFRIPAGDLVFGSEDEEGDCETTVTVTRTNRGRTDSVLDGESDLRLHQVRSINFDSTP